MRVASGVTRLIASGLILFLAIPLEAAAASAQQQAAPSIQSETSQPASNTVSAGDQAKDANTPSAPVPQSSQQAAVPTDTQNSAEPQNGAAKPVGTAIAPREKTMGVTASRPAGAVIAPAKQRRVRALVIKIGVIVGAGVAIGTVAALSHSSPSQPH